VAKSYQQVRKKKKTVSSEEQGGRKRASTRSLPSGKICQEGNARKKKKKAGTAYSSDLSGHELMRSLDLWQEVEDVLEVGQNGKGKGGGSNLINRQTGTDTSKENQHLVSMQSRGSDGVRGNGGRRGGVIRLGKNCSPR